MSTIDDSFFANEKLQGLSRLITNVKYHEKTGKQLFMDLIVPWTVEHSEEKQLYPLILFVQGSAWMTADRSYEIPQLSEIARHGFVVATMEHRSILENAPFPAYIEDVKMALNFLCEKKEDYCIDASRIFLWGSSSGANAVLMTTMLANSRGELFFEDVTWKKSIRGVVSCFGPTDLYDLLWEKRDEPEINLVLRAALGEDVSFWEQKLQWYSPCKWVESLEHCPPIYLLHGTEDKEVSYEQMLKFSNQLSEKNFDVKTACVHGAGHEWDFWSEDVYESIGQFFLNRE